MIKTTTFITALMLLSGTLSAAPLSYADNQYFPLGYVDFDRAGPLALVNYPAAQPGHPFQVQTSYRVLYNISELTDNRLAVSYAHRRFVTGAALAVFGKADYFQQLGLSAFGSYRVRNVIVGGSLIYSRYSFSDTYSALDAVTINAGIGYRYHEFYAFGTTRSINNASYGQESEDIPAEGEIGVSYTTVEGLDSQAKALFTKYDGPTGELSQSLRLAEYASVNWTLVLSPPRFGGGLNLHQGHLGFEYKISHHPLLGPTHSVYLTIY
jgi:hypothetical protein